MGIFTRAVRRIPESWKVHYPPDHLFYLRYHHAWHAIDPKSPDACFAAESDDRMLLFEVLAFLNDKQNRKSAEVCEDLLHRSMAERFLKYKLKSRNVARLGPVDDPQLRQYDTSAWNVARPEQSRHMVCRMMDGIACFQESYALLREETILHLNFKVAKALYRKNVAHFELVARSALVGLHARDSATESEMPTCSMCDRKVKPIAHDRTTKVLDITPDTLDQLILQCLDCRQLFCGVCIAGGREGLVGDCPDCGGPLGHADSADD